jgi:PIN domain nuclease of toxin-antitoxin system
MRLLLDTHAFIWWDDESPKLDDELRSAIADPSNEIFVSSACVWEIAIKRRRGKIDFMRDIADAVASNGFLPLPITHHHAERAGSLPPHHGDPFDRMLVAQATIEGLTLGTQDEVIRAYGIATIGLPRQ